MTTQTHPTPSMMQDAAAMRPRSASTTGASVRVAPTLGAAHLRMANERTTSCLGADDYPREAPFLIVVMLLVACASCVLLIGFFLKLFGL